MSRQREHFPGTLLWSLVVAAAIVASVFVWGYIALAAVVLFPLAAIVTIVRAFLREYENPGPDRHYHRGRHIKVGHAPRHGELQLPGRTPKPRAPERQDLDFGD